MTTTSHPHTAIAAESLFPDFSQFVYNRPLRGKAFTVMIENRGYGSHKQEISFDAKAWTEARQSPTFEADYQLAMAKLLLQIAVKVHT